jgi:hypothetical protein
MSPEDVPWQIPQGPFLWGQIIPAAGRSSPPPPSIPKQHQRRKRAGIGAELEHEYTPDISLPFWLRRMCVKPDWRARIPKLCARIAAGASGGVLLRKVLADVPGRVRQ